MPSDPIVSKPCYPSSNAYGIPDLPYAPLSAVPNEIVPFRAKIRRNPARIGVHFFLYDAIFESAWNTPNRTIQYLSRYGMALTPDFSLHPEMPLAVQLFNTYRSRWCGAHWHAHGLRVIPTVSWSTPDSYAFCFDGIPRYSVVALTTLGTRRDKTPFLHGFDAMIERIQPAVVLCYGQPLAGMERVPLTVYPNRWERVKAESHGG
jgi:hypothetical protein